MKAKITIDSEPINELNDWDFPDTKSIPKGYDWETVPDISAANIGVLVDKTNEIVRRVNELTTNENAPEKK